MAASMCRTLLRSSFLLPTTVLPLCGQRGLRLAGRTTFNPSIAPAMSSSRHIIPGQNRTSWIRHTVSDSSVFTVFVRQLFTQVRNRFDHKQLTGSSAKISDLTLTPIGKLGSWTDLRQINTCSKLGKRKTCKAVAKRFLRTGKGKLKRWRAGKSHNMMSKGSKRSRQLSKPTYCSKQQLKLLNKMLNGW